MKGWIVGCVGVALALVYVVSFGVPWGRTAAKVEVRCIGGGDAVTCAATATEHAVNSACWTVNLTCGTTHAFGKGCVEALAAGQTESKTIHDFSPPLTGLTCDGIRVEALEIN